ncbi:MAG: PQQ-binding-like beta-propeller repeat protein [Bythopirellula sp.]
MLRTPIVCLLCLSCVATARADDWPQWGGPQRDSVWREQGLLEKLPAGQLPQVWSTPIAAGYAGPAVADGRVYVTDRVAEEDLERVHCFDSGTGAPLWQHDYTAKYTVSYPLGPRATPTVDDNRVYVLGAMGHLFCLATADGGVIWEKDLPAEYGTKLPIWGMAAAPLVDGNQLIVLVGGRDNALVVSFDKQTGAELWRSLEDRGVGYCAPIVLEYGGRRQLVVWHPEAVSALDPSDGKLLWEVPFDVRAGLTIPTPRKLGKRLFVTSFYNGPLMIDLGNDGATPEIVWQTDPSSTEIKNNTLHAIMCSPIVRQDAIYGVGSYGEFRCLDPATGETLWETFAATGKGRWWNAFLIPHHDQVFICNEQGELIRAKLSPTGYQELDRAQLIEPTEPVKRRITVWSHPAFAEKSIFARNNKELVRVNLSAR